MDEKNSGFFNVAIDAFDGTELVNKFLFHKLSEDYLTLYGDDGLAVFKSVCCLTAEKNQKIVL